MKIIKELNDISFSVELFITIGNFDGVHFGHSKILQFIKDKAAQNKSKFLVITFVPHPLLLLKPCQNYLVNSYEERRGLLEEEGVDFLFEIEFGRDFSNLSPSDFLEKFILASNHKKHLYLGHDFAFGSGKKGDYEFTKNYCNKDNIEVLLLPKFNLNNKPVSSSLVREFLRKGDLKSVNNLLRRSYFIQGTVVKGHARGASIGFPTANIAFLKERITPAIGVYITKTQIDDAVYQSVTNVGHNPTFESEKILHIETHILDFDRKIYGKEIKVSFLKKVRDEIKFNSVNELVFQIKKDLVTAKEFFMECHE